MKNQKGITLIALIITIIVMLILVGVSVSTAINTGLFRTASGVAQNTEAEKLKETNLSSGKVTIRREDGELEEVDIESFSQLGENKNYISDEDDIYEGCYADVDGDGTVDGVIYADLAFAGGEGSYEWQAVDKEDLKKYCISGTHNGTFGTKDVITASGTGNNRFYVMALADKEGYYTFYAQDSGATNVTEGGVLNDEGKEIGKLNTDNMISAWEDSKFGPQTESDIWGNIETEVSKGWFVPSVGEWTAFYKQFNIATGDAYVSVGIDIPYDLSEVYWTSTQYNLCDGGEYVLFGEDQAYDPAPNWGFSVRLSITF